MNDSYGMKELRESVQKSRKNALLALECPKGRNRAWSVEQARLMGYSYGRLHALLGRTTPYEAHDYLTYVLKPLSRYNGHGGYGGWTEKLTLPRSDKDIREAWTRSRTRVADPRVKAFIAAADAELVREGNIT